MVKLWEFLQWIFDGLHGIKDALMGSLIYSLYSHFHLKKTLWKNVMAFFTGTVFSIYLTPQVVYFFPTFNESLAAFLCGLLGMKGVELTIEFNYEELLERIISIKWGKKDKDTKSDKG